MKTQENLKSLIAIVERQCDGDHTVTVEEFRAALDASKDQAEPKEATQIDEIRERLHTILDLIGRDDFLLDTRFGPVLIWRYDKNEITHSSPIEIRLNSHLTPFNGDLKSRDFPGLMQFWELREGKGVEVISSAFRLGKYISENVYPDDTRNRGADVLKAVRGFASDPRVLARFAQGSQRVAEAAK